MKCINIKTIKSLSSSSHFQREKWKMRDKRIIDLSAFFTFFVTIFLKFKNFLHRQLLQFSYEFLLEFVLAYRKGYTANYISIRLIENWKSVLDKNLFAGAVLIDMYKAFLTFVNLVVVKLYAYDLNLTVAECLVRFLWNLTLVYLSNILKLVLKLDVASPHV